MSDQLPPVLDDEHKPKHVALGDKIDDLILAATDPKDKAFLMILNKIADNLDENTKLTRSLTKDLKAHTDAFSQHEKDEMALINQGRGFWRAALGAVLLVQALGVWWIQGHLQRIEGIESMATQSQIAIAEHKVHHEIEERYSGISKVKK